MRIPVPSPGACARDQENLDDRRSDLVRISVFETAPIFSASTQPTRRAPGNISQDLLGTTLDTSSGIGNPFDRIRERRGSFHESNTPAPRQSFRQSSQRSLIAVGRGQRSQLQ